MGFKMNCDRCGRFIKNMSIVELRKQTDYTKEVLCTSCINWETNAKRGVEKAIDKMKGDLEKYRTGFVEEIQNICKASRTDTVEEE